jgi:hypothetical protein
MSAPAKYQPYNPANSARPTHVSQATAIEQSRAIAEVQAAVVVAQSCPRDMQEAEAEMEYVCGRLDMAEQAFYQVTNRGTGPSVHLMRELARIWGNVDYGVKELHRDDAAGESEVQAFSWDIQKNTRSSRTFINPHQRMVKVQGVRQRVDLDDLTDIYLSNQNIGARAVRECIATILPRWFTEKAQNVCRNTLENGEGEPLQDRINKMVAWFDQSFGITEKQIATRLEKTRGQWTAADVAQMKIAGTSIQRGEASKDDLFPAIVVQSVTADEITPPPAEDKAKAAPAKKAAAPKLSAARTKLNGRMFTLLTTAGVGDDKHRADRLIVLSKLVDRTVESSNDLTDDEVANVIETLAALIDQDTGDAAALDDWVTGVLNAHDAAQDNPEPAGPATETVQEETK